MREWVTKVWFAGITPQKSKERNPCIFPHSTQLIEREGGIQEKDLRERKKKKERKENRKSERSKGKPPKDQKERKTTHHKKKKRERSQILRLQLQKRENGGGFFMDPSINPLFIWSSQSFTNFTFFLIMFILFWCNMQCSYRSLVNTRTIISIIPSLAADEGSLEIVMAAHWNQEEYTYTQKIMK